MPKDVNRVIAKFQARVAGAAEEYAAGVQNPAVDWMTAYTKAQPRMKQAIQEAIAKDKFVTGARKAGGTQNWQNKAVEKGARNYAAASQDAAAGYAEKAQMVIEAGEAARKATEGMPDTTLEQRIAKSAAAQKAIAAYWAGKK